ncbi:hypothetical protein SAMN05216386_2165 [Nitrosospira briensis]|uniref:Uncharacterized protein n=1 Tax=Nitrosospira briensis TaxID=35799 RepID=A0A1I5CVZ5_9PROT|nr:hypothetical protein [Nitrosospira briensis]SFN91097.1 hypothetical protein SAMN05216386_2165 [Nitrosospira briensis]
MKGLYSDKGRYRFHVVEGGEPLSGHSPILPNEEEYQRITTEGKDRYKRRAPVWCECDMWTTEEAASLLSGMLPRSDHEGRIFYLKYCADMGTIVIGGIEYKDLAFGLFTPNFDCYGDVLQILKRSPVVENASPREWARYAQSKGLLPHKNRAHIDNNPLLTLLEPSTPSVALTRSRTASISRPQSEVQYSTRWLTLLEATINHFYNPRRDPDAKKEEVVEWITSTGAYAGLKVSRQIAETIFTIIKPEDHDPKKKGAEPL